MGVILPTAKKILVGKLLAELKAAGFPAQEVAWTEGTGITIATDGSETQAQVDGLQAIIDNRIPFDTRFIVMKQLRDDISAINLDITAPTTLAQAAADIVRLKRIVRFLLAEYAARRMDSSD